MNHCRGNTDGPENRERMIHPGEIFFFFCEAFCESEKHTFEIPKERMNKGIKPASLSKNKDIHIHKCFRVVL